MKTLQNSASSTTEFILPMQEFLNMDLENDQYDDQDDYCPEGMAEYMEISKSELYNNLLAFKNDTENGLSAYFIKEYGRDLSDYLNAFAEIDDEFGCDLSDGYREYTSGDDYTFFQCLDSVLEEQPGYLINLMSEKYFVGTPEWESVEEVIRDVLMKKWDDEEEEFYYDDLDVERNIEDIVTNLYSPDLYNALFTTPTGAEILEEVEEKIAFEKENIHYFLDETITEMEFCGLPQN